MCPLPPLEANLHSTSEIFEKKVAVCRRVPPPFRDKFSFNIRSFRKKSPCVFSCGQICIQYRQFSEKKSPCAAVCRRVPLCTAVCPPLETNLHSTSKIFEKKSPCAPFGTESNVFEKSRRVWRRTAPLGPSKMPCVF